MTFIYPAVITVKEDGNREGYFPDLTGCSFSGGTLEDTLQEAAAAEEEWLQAELEEEEPFFPRVSDENDIELMQNETLHWIRIHIRPHHAGFG